MKLIKRYHTESIGGKYQAGQMWYIPGDVTYRGIGRSDLEEKEIRLDTKPTGLWVKDYPTEEEALAQIEWSKKYNDFQDIKWQLIEEAQERFEGKSWEIKDKVERLIYNYCWDNAPKDEGPVVVQNKIVDDKREFEKLKVHVFEELKKTYKEKK